MAVDSSTETLLVMSRYVDCFTFSQGRRTESDDRQQRVKQANLCSRVSTRSRTNIIRKTDSVTKGNEQNEKLTQTELVSQLQENNSIPSVAAAGGVCLLSPF